MAYHTFEGITLFEDEKQRMIQSLGNQHILVLHNHGVAVGESSIEKAFFLLWTVQRAAEIQCLADSMQGADVLLEDPIKQKCADLTQMLINDSGFADKFFKAMVRKMHEKAKAAGGASISNICQPAHSSNPSI